MRRIGVRHIDNRRTLTPRDYVENPWTFGTPAAVLVLPPGGDPVSFRIAAHHHQLVLAVRASGIRASEVCERFAFGRDIWSDVLNGHRWPGETVSIAIVDALTRISPRRH